ncbi:hypothetical protein B0H17DRAFT_345580 [Mycena rosella]|uniref:F-box domain-containing protein n=1 Tax=Mycena rosella TaxID=1033263 RepID=A0AAD7G5T8_MYCRO|nr:hypothetical protein B0H17DRAFT_345580 [Mycena rosella]
MSATRCSECGAAVTASSWSAEALNINVSVAPGTLMRHQELMTTNALPQDAEILFIQAVVAKIGARLADIEKKISEVRRRLQQLEDERASLSKYRAQNNAVVSPLRHMPPEVLAEIFSWTLPTTREALDRRKFDINDGPWVLTHISSRWRAVALSTSALWSRVDVNCGQPRANPLPMLKTQIERAHKLKIHFHGQEKKPAGPQIEIFRFLAEHSSRWEELVISLTPHLVPLLDTLQNRLPVLHRLWLQFQRLESQDVVALHCFRHAPSLLHVGIQNCHRYIPVSFPASQLTQYSLDAPWKVHAGILKSAINLIQARVIVNFNNDPWPEPDIINLMCLRGLYVSHSVILDHLRAPALHGIMIGVTSNPEPARHLLPFVSRSSCNVTRLGLRGPSNSDQVTEILRKLPSVGELVILLTRASVPIPEILGSTVLAPQLRSISFGWEQECHDYALCLKILQSRWDAENCALKAASLLHISGTGPDTRTLQGLEVLRQDGLDLSLLNGNDASDAIHASSYSASWA